jgi:hypothetical protein
MEFGFTLIGFLIPIPVLTLEGTAIQVGMVVEIKFAITRQFKQDKQLAVLVPRYYRQPFLAT